MALTSLPKSRSAVTGMDFFRKVMGYWIYGTCVRFSEYSPSLSLLYSLAPIVSTAPTTSSLVSVTGVEVVKIDTSFWASRNTWLRNLPSGDSCSTQHGRHPSLLSWQCWRYHLFQGNHCYNYLFSPFGAKNLLAGSLSPSSGWQRKFAEWKMVAFY